MTVLVYGSSEAVPEPVPVPLPPQLPFTMKGSGKARQSMPIGAGPRGWPKAAPGPKGARGSVAETPKAKARPLVPTPKARVIVRPTRARNPVAWEDDVDVAVEEVGVDVNVEEVGYEEEGVDVAVEEVGYEEEGVDVAVEEEAVDYDEEVMVEDDGGSAVVGAYVAER